MKKLILDIGFDFEFVLYGIVSEERPHTLAWQLNNHISSHFTRGDDLMLDFGNEQKISMPYFEYNDELNHLSFSLFSNKDEADYWVPELKHIDYFIMVKGALEAFKKRKYTEPFKKVPGVRIIMEINHRKLKQKERLIF